jgi:uncharacterized protein YegJ (DUF2314 family)
VATLEADGWELGSAEAAHATAPATFEIPPEAVRANLKPGAFAKLIFVMRGSEGVRVERMWVRVTACHDGSYLGTLNNDPVTVGAPITDGQEVTFGSSHIAGVIQPDA